MSPSKLIYKSMKFDREYSYGELAVMTSIPEDEVRKVCGYLVDAHLIREVTAKTGKVSKPSKKVVSNQRGLDV